MAQQKRQAPSSSREDPQRRQVVQEVVHHLAVGKEVVQMLENDGAITVKDALWRTWIPTQPSARYALSKYKAFFEKYKHLGPFAPPETVYAFTVNIANLPSAEVKALVYGGYHIHKVPQLKKEDLNGPVLEMSYDNIEHIDDAE